MLAGIASLCHKGAFVMKDSNKCIISIALTLLFLPSLAFPYDLCVGSGYTFGFFNGVWNTEGEAYEGLENLKRLVGKMHDSEPIQYELFYNHTNGLEDIAETFQQRAQEIDPTGVLKRRIDLFWDSISGNKT